MSAATLRIAGCLGAVTMLGMLAGCADSRSSEESARVLPSGQEAVVIAIRTGDAADELTRYTAEHMIDLAIVQGADAHAHALLAKGRCSLLVLR